MSNHPELHTAKILTRGIDRQKGEVFGDQADHRAFPPQTKKKIYGGIVLHYYAWAYCSMEHVSVWGSVSAVDHRSVAALELMPKGGELGYVPVGI